MLAQRFLDSCIGSSSRFPEFDRSVSQRRDTLMLEDFQRRSTYAPCRYDFRRQIAIYTLTGHLSCGYMLGE